MHRKQVTITVLCILISAGYLYNQESPQSLETPLREPPYNFTSIQYNMIFVATMLPIALCSIPLGMLIDRIPLKYSCWLIIGAQFLSQTAMAVLFFFSFEGFYWVVLLTRVIFGLTTESAYTLQSIIAERNVRKQNLDLVLNLCWTVPMWFEGASSFIATAVYDSTKMIYLPLFIGAGVCFVSLCASLIAASITKKQKDPQQEEQQPGFNIKDLKLFQRGFWFYIGVIFVGNLAMTPYLDNLTDLLVKRFGIEYATAGILVVIPGCACPFFSFIWIWALKKYPRQRRNLFIIMAAAIVIMHGLMILIPNTDEPTTGIYFLIGLALALHSLSFAGLLGIVSPSTTMMVPKQLVGTAYGCIGCVFALAMAVMPIVNGLTTSIDPNLQQSYLYLQYVYVPVSIIYFSMLLYIRFSASSIFSKLDVARDNQGEEQPLKQSLISNSD